MLRGLNILESQNKKSGENSVKKKLDDEIAKMKLVQASQAAKSIMYSRQHFLSIEINQTARVLAQGNSKTSYPDKMISKTGKKVNTLKDKLDILTDYYSDLYKSSHPAESCIKHF